MYGGGGVEMEDDNGISLKKCGAEFPLHSGGMLMLYGHGNFREIGLSSPPLIQQITFSSPTT